MGAGIPGMVFLLFLTLKLCDVIAWSWWWVTAPLWIPAGIVLAFFLVACLCTALWGGAKSYQEASFKRQW